MLRRVMVPFTLSMWKRSPRLLSGAPCKATSGFRPQHRWANTKADNETHHKSTGETVAERHAERTSVRQISTKRTTSQLDEDMRRAMEGLAGDGGEAGIELEDGKPVAMKRGVRENMFRYI